jgi:hypothetical protein
MIADHHQARIGYEWANQRFGYPNTPSYRKQYKWRDVQFLP